jgi:hypothetical protein
MQDSQNKINDSKHKNLSETTEHQNQQTDNTTNVYIRLDEPKGVACFRCNKALWKSFKKQIRAQGLSICHVLEAMIYGWLHGNVYISNTIKPIRIENLVVERAVKRVRRYAVEVDDGGVGERRFYCALKDCHVPVESLPLSACHGCPNRGCRGFVLERGVEVE